MLGKDVVWTAVAIMVAGFLTAEVAYGQACAGVPIPRGSYGGQLEAGFADRTTTYGGSATANLPGRLSLGAGYGLTNGNAGDRAHTFSGRIAFELPRLPLAICPMAGLRYATASRGGVENGATGSSLTVPAGLGKAHPFRLTRNASVTPYLASQLLVRISASDEEGTGQGLGSERRGSSQYDTDFGVGKGAGFVVGIQRFFGGLDVEVSTLEGGGTVYRVGLGMRF
jgi:hypothetical protein